MPDAVTPVSGVVPNGLMVCFRWRASSMKPVVPIVQVRIDLRRARALDLAQGAIGMHDTCGRAPYRHTQDRFVTGGNPGNAGGRHLVAFYFGSIRSGSESRGGYPGHLPVCQRKLILARSGQRILPDGPGVGGESLFAGTCRFVPGGTSGALEIVKTGRGGLPVTASPSVFQFIDAAAGTPCGFTKEEAGHYRFGGSETDLSTAEGVLRLAGIPEAPGGWILREITAPEGYLELADDIPVVRAIPPQRLRSRTVRMVSVCIVDGTRRGGGTARRCVFGGAVFEIWHRDYRISPPHRKISASASRYPKVRIGWIPGCFAAVRTRVFM